MTVICLGPCCIPVSAFFPLLLLLVSPILNILRKTPLAKYLPDPDVPKKGKGTSSTRATTGAGDNTAKPCCADASCSNGETASSTGTGDVTVVKSLEHWHTLKTTEPLLIADFTAGWCKPCQKMAPVFEGLATEYEGVASFVKVDIDDLPETFDGVSIPAFHVLKGGAKVDSVSGAGEQRLRSMVARHCKKSN